MADTFAMNPHGSGPRSTEYAGKTPDETVGWIGFFRGAWRVLHCSDKLLRLLGLIVLPARLFD